MYGSCPVHLKNITPQQNEVLQTLSHMSASIYNLALDVVKHHYGATNSMPSVEFIIQQIDNTPQYKASSGRLNQAVSQAVSDYKTYLATKQSIGKKTKQTVEAKGLAHFQQPKPKNGMMAIRITKQAVLGAMLTIPATKVTPALVLTLPADYGELDIIFVVLRPAFSFRAWEAILTYSIRIKETTPTNQAMGIDLGLTNFATCATTAGDSFILDGRYLKGLVQGFNKYTKKLKPPKGQYSKRYASLQRKSRNRIRDYVSKCAAYVVQYCQQHDITTVCVGWGTQFWQGFIGKTTKLFHFMPYKAFSKALAHQCRKNGIYIKWVDECFTSQASFLDQDQMPEHITRTEQHFSGKRRYRGLYVSSNKTKINADVNGALNILKKSNAISLVQIEAICSRGIAQPQRVKPLKV